MKSTISLLLLIGVLAAGCRTAPVASMDAVGDATWVKGRSYRDSEIGLSKTGLFDAPSPDVVLHNKATPDDGKKPPRAYKGAPPVISHDIRDIDPISRKQHDCTVCHEGILLPKSHLVDLRNAPDQQGKKLYGARYNCLACHVPMTMNNTLVENLLNLPGSSVCRGAR